jgi:hypothetical protein
VSYDIYLRADPDPCPTCGRSDDDAHCPDPTYNLTPIFDLALTGEPLPNADVSEFSVVLLRKETDRPRGLRLLSGKKALETTEWLRKAVGHLNDPRREPEFRALEPENKWGDLEGAREVMTTLLSLAERYPTYVWEVR